eukprot:GHRQ01014101.1.p1 GENE.GHRQ01014101.1~~GHRQ01014101.1.p1  ORF type:complete len:122 (-),score=12.22 GHRQ01014101.1:42-407(-)
MQQTGAMQREGCTTVAAATAQSQHGLSHLSNANLTNPGISFRCDSRLFHTSSKSSEHSGFTLNTFIATKHVFGAAGASAAEALQAYLLPQTRGVATTRELRLEASIVCDFGQVLDRSPLCL